MQPEERQVCSTVDRHVHSLAREVQKIGILTGRRANCEEPSVLSLLPNAYQARQVGLASASLSTWSSPPSVRQPMATRAYEERRQSLPYLPL